MRISGSSSMISSRLGVICWGCSESPISAAPGLERATDAPELVDECFEAVNDRNKVLRILSIAKSAIRHNMAKDLPSMNVPVCLIWGKNDIITPPEVAEEFLAGFPDADLHWIDECGHAPMMEHPGTFNQILSDWFASRGIS